MEFSDDDLLWLIQEEIKNQEYTEFKEEILSQNPENLHRIHRNSHKNLSRPRKPDRKTKKTFKRTKHKTSNQT